MAFLFSDNAQKVITFLQNTAGTDQTAQDIADATGLPVKTVQGVVTSALKRRGLADRKEVDHLDKKVIYLTATGLETDPMMEKPE